MFPDAIAKSLDLYAPLAILNSNSEYKSKFNNNWSIRYETIKYSIQDCIALHNVLINYNNLIYKLFNVNIINYPTLSSLALGIYRSKYLKDYKIFKGVLLLLKTS